MEKELKNARIWSNNELKKVCQYFGGDIINVSGEQDRDKQGAGYKEYFNNATSYSISNYQLFNLDNEIFLDLEQELPVEYQGKYDVVFNHTVLEHVFDIRTAFKNLCKLAKKAVIIVVPFVQEVHYKKDVYWDYWRPTPIAIKRMFEENGFTLLYYSSNNMEFTNTYLFCIGVKNEMISEYALLDNRPHDYHSGGWVGKYGAEWTKNARLKQKIRGFLHIGKRH